MNILGFNIGQNYKGILNIGSTINSPLSGTLQAVTDGMGVASPLQLSTARAAVIAAVNYDSLFVGGLPAAGIKISQSSDPSVNGWILSVNGSFGDWFSLGFGNTNVSSTALISGSRITRDINIHTSMYVGIGNAVTTPSARLHVRGDGTNPIARFENNAGTIGFRISADGTSFEPISSAGAARIVAGYNGGLNLDGSVLTINANTADGQSNVTAIMPGSYGGGWRNTHNNYNFTSGNTKTFHNSGGFGAAAGSANYRNAQFEYTLNNSGAQTGTATGIFLNATETALNGMTHNLMDLQVGGSSRFRVTNGGILSVGGLGGSAGEIRFRRSSDGNEVGTVGTGGSVFFVREGQGAGGELQTFDGTAVVRWVGVGSAARFQFGGTTNAFPALKRNGAALEVRLADDSANAGLTAAFITAVNGTSRITTIRTSNINDDLNAVTAINIANTTANLTFYTSSLFAASGTINASARVQIDSTTQGFLPPRQTEAQRLAISSPAVGLIVYQTDASDGLYVYKTGGWTLIV